MRHKPDLVAPVQITVHLMGLSGDGAYGVTSDAKHLEAFLTQAFPRHCPHIIETGQKLSICHDITYRVVSSDGLLRPFQEAMKEAMHWDGASVPDDLLFGPFPPPWMPQYTVDAAVVEKHLDQVLEAVYEGNEDAEVRAPLVRHTWHQDNVLLVLNPAKPAMLPEDLAAVTRGLNTEQRARRPTPVPQLTPGEFVSSWDRGRLGMDAIRAMEAGFRYSYSYNGAGAAATWVASSGYVVLDLSAGPCLYGPDIAASGAVAPTAIPRWQEIFTANAEVLGVDSPEGVPQNKHVFDAARQHRDSLFRGHLASLLFSAARHAFIPDIAIPDFVVADHTFLPVIVLRNHALFDPLEKGGAHSLDVGAVVDAASALTGGAVGVLPGLHDLHTHRHLAVAFSKALQTSSEAVLEAGEPGVPPGMHSRRRTQLDGDLLLEAFAEAADELTSIMVQEEDDLRGWPQDRIKKNSAILPVYLLSVAGAPPDLLFDTRGLMVASHRAVIVLQAVTTDDAGNLTDAGVPSGHSQDGLRVEMSSLSVTRHVVAGLATALAGVAPPYRAFNPLRGAPEDTWLWSQGAQPFGAYSNTHTLPESAFGVAQRNRLLMRIHDAMGGITDALDTLNGFVDRHMRTPFARPLDSVYEVQAAESWVDAMYRAAGAETPVPWAVSAQVEAHLEQVEAAVVRIGRHLFSQEYHLAEGSVGGLEALSRRVADVTAASLDAARERMECCGLEHRLPAPGGMPGWLRATAFCAAVSVLLLPCCIRLFAR